MGRVKILKPPTKKPSGAGAASASTRNKEQANTTYTAPPKRTWKDCTVIPTINLLAGVCSVLRRTWMLTRRSSAVFAITSALVVLDLDSFTYIILWIVLPPGTWKVLLEKDYTANPDDKTGGGKWILAAYFGKRTNMIKVFYPHPDSEPSVQVHRQLCLEWRYRLGLEYWLWLTHRYFYRCIHNVRSVCLVNDSDYQKWKWEVKSGHQPVSVKMYIERMGNMKDRGEKIGVMK